MRLTISTGRSRRETRWRVRSTTWERLVGKLRETVRTAETVAVYGAASRDRKAEIKDIGGFVGGAVEGGRRTRGSVRTRTLLTLDMDYATRGAWDDLTMLFGCAMCLYSTHSHTPETPRYRLLMPLSREVGAEEYEAVGRKVAETVGIEMFDDSTYQAERLMYWPSTPRDGEYVFEEQTGAALDVDAVLAEYPGGRWQDVAQWPVSSRVEQVVRQQMRRKGEPTERPGIVGEFCRAYTVTEAIATLLADVYEPTEGMAGRYTYRAGTSSGGLVVYDDKFAYSHHATDPVCGLMCNAFDLVRVHLYGVMDAETADGTPVNRLPSFAEMTARLQSDERVMRERNARVEARLREDFGDIAAGDGEPSGTAWMDELERERGGNIRSTSRNIMAVLNHAPGLGGNLRRNDFTGRDEALGDLPWRKIQAARETEWTNDDDARLRVYMETVYGIVGKEKILNCFTEVMTAHRYHPVREYLTAREWDGEERVETLLTDYLGAADTPLNREIARKTLVAAVARVFQPGCKFDYVTVLQGPQGIGKSTLLRVLAGDEWFNDSMIDLSSKDAMENLQGSWLIELGELQAIKRSDIENVKAFLSRQTDTYRPAYGRTRESHPRQCVFFATTNEAAFLKGSEGNRRFWVVPCEGTDGGRVFAIDEALRGQIWAEAYYLYKRGEPLYLDQDRETQMRERQEEYNETAQDERVGVIQEYLDKPLPAEWPQMDLQARAVYLADADQIERNGTSQRNRVCAAEILVECFHERLDDKTVYKSRKIAELMTRIKGWHKAKRAFRIPGYGVQKGFMRNGTDV